MTSKKNNAIKVNKWIAKSILIIILLSFIFLLLLEEYTQYHIDDTLTPLWLKIFEGIAILFSIFSVFYFFPSKKP